MCKTVILYTKMNILLDGHNWQVSFSIYESVRLRLSFNERNSWMERLLTTILLDQYNFKVGRISLKERRFSEERLLWITPPILRAYAPDQQDPFPWINYLLSTILATYKELEDRVGLVTTGSQNTHQIRPLQLRNLSSVRHTVSHKEKGGRFPDSLWKFSSLHSV